MQLVIHFLITDLLRTRPPQSRHKQSAGRSWYTQQSRPCEKVVSSLYVPCAVILPPSNTTMWSIWLSIETEFVTRIRVWSKPMAAQRAHDAIITSSLRPNDVDDVVLTLWRRYHCVIIAWCVRWETMLNPLWPTSDDMWRHRIWTTLVQLMSCCLTAPSQSMLNNHKGGLVAFTWGQYRRKTRLIWF